MNGVFIRVCIRVYLIRFYLSGYEILSLREGSMRMVLISGNSLTSFDQLKLDRGGLFLSFMTFSVRKC